MLLGQLKMSSLSQPGAEPVLLLLFEGVCVWWGGRLETMTGFSLFWQQMLHGIPCFSLVWCRKSLAQPSPIISRSSEYHWRSHVSPSSPPSFLELRKHQVDDIQRKGQFKSRAASLSSILQ